MSARSYLGDRWCVGPFPRRQLYAEAVRDIIRPVETTIYLLAELSLVRAEGRRTTDQGEPIIVDAVAFGQDVEHVAGPEPYVGQVKSGRVIVIPKHCLLVVRNIRIGLAEQVKAHLILDRAFALCVDDTGEMPTAMVTRTLRLEREQLAARQRRARQNVR